jgi:hypothetical protein
MGAAEQRDCRQVPTQQRSAEPSLRCLDLEFQVKLGRARRRKRESNASFPKLESLRSNEKLLDRCKLLAEEPDYQIIEIFGHQAIRNGAGLAVQQYVASIEPSGPESDGIIVQLLTDVKTNSARFLRDRLGADLCPLACHKIRWIGLHPVLLTPA